MNLDELFKKAFTDEKIQSQFYFELLTSNIYVLGECENFDGLIDEGSEIKLVSIKNDKESFIPIFLSLESMEVFLEGRGQEYIKARGSDILETIRLRNIVVNPGQEDSIILYADEIQFILSQGKN